MNKTIIALLLTATMGSCKSQIDVTTDQKNQMTGLQDSLTKRLKMVNEEGEVVGFSVNIMTPSEVLYNQGFGYRNSKDSSAYSTSTIQNIGSVAKTVLGVALLKAQELGKININDPVAKYLPFNVVNPNHPKTPITVLQLATHSSSIIDNQENYLKAFILEKEEINKEEEVAFSHFQKPEKRITLFEFLKSCLAKDGQWYTPKMFSEHKPGSTFEYSNFGADLCGLIIEQATGMSYADFTKKYIFNPLKMYDSGWAIKDVDSLKRSNFYLFKGQKIADYTAITYPNGDYLPQVKI